ncbi:MAG: cysteine desulfurase family protein [Flavobacterium sp.]
MKKVYFDNASTTALRPEVVACMTDCLMHDYGNPSSTHSLGRHSKSILELSRKSIAKALNATAQEILFTSGGTEANNWILRSAVKDLKVKRIISSKMEHHAVLYPILELQKEFGIKVDFVQNSEEGVIDLTHLVSLLSDASETTLVSLMHVNNETGVILDLERVATICKEHGALLHSDTVQSVGKTMLDLQKLPIDFIVSSAHKFHGPKGIGFAFVRKNSGIQPLFFGGEQEKGLRSGTEAIHQIAGMAKALEIAYANLEHEREHIKTIKQYTIAQLALHFPGVKENGTATFHPILNIQLPFSADKTAMILFYLDMKGIFVSRGSACQSGSVKASHVLAEMLSDTDLKKPSLRISFSHLSTQEEVDLLIEALKGV